MHAAPVVSDSPAPSRAPSPRSSITRLGALTWCGLPAGAAVLAWAYSNAAGHDGTAHFYLFWLGIGLFVAPASVRLIAPGTSDRERYWLLVALGLFLFVPKYLRDPAMPLFHDELAHWRQAEEIKRTGEAFNSNYTIYIIGQFPGLHLLTAGFSWLTGLSTFRAAQVLLAALHVLSLIGVAELARTVLRDSARTGAIAALIYAVNPSYMFFHAQFAYESLSIVFVIWALVAVAKISQQEPSGRFPSWAVVGPGSEASEKFAWLAVAALISAACTVTHHLTTYVLLALLTACAGAAAFQAFRGLLNPVAAAQAIVLAGLLASAATLWIVFIAHDALAYLEPNLVKGVHGLTGIVQHRSESRTLFTQSPLPLGERALGIASVPVTGLLTLLGLLQIRSRALVLRAPVVLPVAIALGLVYFASLPFLLSPGGAESAHRSWSYAFIGLALVCTIGVERITSTTQRTASRRLLAGAGLACAFTTVLVGNVANGVNEAYRFPGPYIWGSDTRSLSPELLGITRRFRASFGDHQKVIADRYSALALASFGNAQTASPSPGFRVWQLYFDPSPSKRLLSQLAGGRWRFIVVDRRMPHVTPLRGYYIYNDEQKYVGAARPSPVALTQYDKVPWASKVMQSSNYSVYELNPERMRTAAR